MYLKRTYRTIGIPCIIVLLFFSSAVTINDEASAYTPHSPVYIDGNGDFTLANGVTSGSGTLLDPYVIEGWEINATTANGIEVRNTDAHFVIRNIYVHSGWRGGWPSYNGIYLYNVSHGRLENSTLTGNLEGVFFEQSTENVIVNTVSSWNEFDGVRLLYSDSNMVTNTTASFNHNGIYVESSQNTILANNTMDGNGVYLRGPDLEHWNTHEMDTSNMINGAPLHYWKNRTSGTIPSAAGQVILANCTKVVVENQTILNSSGAVNLGFSSDNIIANNTVSSFYRDGIYLYSSHNNTIANNSASSNGGSGIRLEHSNGTIITENVLDSNGVYGIYLSFSDYNTIDNNTVYDSGWGIHLWFSDSNAISSNQAERHRWDGIRLWYADHNSIDNNEVSNNWAGISLGDCDYDTITNNTIHANDVYGIDLSYTNRSIIANNTILSNNEFGLHLFLSEINQIYHNSFVDNVEQVHEFQVAFNNKWDNDYPSGGNYWSDYSGSDQFSGPNQDQPGSDGIGDTPYVMHAGSRDRYPFISPLGTILTRPPGVFQATLSGLNLESVTLNWSLSPDDGVGFKSVIGYRIFRNLTYDPKGLGYQLTASVPNGTYTFVDNFAGEGDPNNYFYYVCAINGTGNSSCSSNQAGKFTRPLSKGPNLVSIPLIQSDETIQTVLQTLSFDNAWSYDPINQEWRSFSKSKPYGQSLEYLNHTTGIWVNVTQDSNLTVAGIVPTSTTINLYAGWNLVGFPSFDDNYTVADLKAAVAVERIEGFDGLAPPYFLRVMTDGDFLQCGFGYWIGVGFETSWTVDNS